VKKGGGLGAPQSQLTSTTSTCGALSEPEWPQQANSHVSACKTTHACNDAQACGRVAEIAGMVNQRGAKGGTIFINNN